MVGIGEMRAALIEDAPAILDLALLADLAEVGEPNTTMELVEADFKTSSLRAAVIDDAAGGLSGYAFVDHLDGHEKCWGDIIVKPGADIVIGRSLVEWLRRTARDLAPGAPCHVFAGSVNLLKQRAYAEAGGEVIRRFFRMGIEFADEEVISVPAPAPGVEIRGVTDDEADLRTMHAIVDVAFRDHFAHESESFETWRGHTFDGTCADLSLWWLGFVDGVPAAGLYSSTLPTSGYVDTLATLREFRGNGLGRLLLLTSFAEFQRRGFRKVVLGVDATNPTGALALYESAGMRAEHQGLRYSLPPLL